VFIVVRVYIVMTLSGNFWIHPHIQNYGGDKSLRKGVLGGCRRSRRI